MDEERQETQQQVPYDPNQMVEMRTEVHDLEIPTEPSRREGEGETAEADEGAPSGAVIRVGSTVSEIKVCQETLRQAMLKALSEPAPDHLMVGPNFEFTAEGSSAQPAEGPTTPSDTSTPDAGASVIPSVPVTEAVSTAGFEGVKSSLEDLGDRFQDLITNLDLQVEYERTDRGAKVRLRNRSEGAEPMDAPDTADTPEPTETSEPMEPTQPAPDWPVQEIHRQKVGSGGVLTVSFRPSGIPAATADADTGAGVNNNNIAFINKRKQAVILFSLADLEVVAQFVVNFNFVFGVESD